MPEHTITAVHFVKDQQSQMGGFYCTRDFFHLIRMYREAYFHHKNSFFIETDLQEMCDIASVDYDALIKAAQIKDVKKATAQVKQVLTGIHKYTELTEMLTRLLHSIYEQTYTSADYMKRLVAMLAPEYCDVPVRTAILKVFLKNTDPDFKVFRLERVVKEVEENLDASARKKIETYADQPDELRRFYADQLKDSIFENHLDGVKLSSCQILDVINTTIENFTAFALYPDLTLKSETFAALKKVLTKYEIPVTEDTTVLSLLVKLGQKNDGSLSFQNDLDPLITDLEAEFRAYLRDPVKSSFNCEAYYHDQRKYARKKANNGWEVLEMCDDLANGNFRTAKAREKLYFFAVMFRMTVSLDRYSRDERDIEKNLFEDYYAYDIKHSLNAPVSTLFERYPTGEGINYKNPIECIYIWYLYHAADFYNAKTPANKAVKNPGQLLTRIQETIKKCIKAAKNSTNEETKQVSTVTAKEDFKTYLMQANEKELPTLLVERWKTDFNAIRGNSRFALNSEQITALETAESLIYTLDHMLTTEDVSSEFDISELIPWDCSEDLKKFFQQPEDREFLDACDSLANYLKLLPNWFSKTERIRMQGVLYLLCQAKEPKNNDHFRLTLGKESWTFATDTRSNPFFIESTTAEISTAISALQACGFPITTVKQKNKKNSKTLVNHFYLEHSEALPEDIQTVLEDLTKQYPSRIASNDKILKNLISKHVHEIRQNQNSERITRAQLMVLFTNTYFFHLKNMSEKELQKYYVLPAMFDNYCQHLNKLLEKSRYQLFSEKNFLDMYIFTCFFYECNKCFSAYSQYTRETLSNVR